MNLDIAWKEWQAAEATKTAAYDVIALRAALGTGAGVRLIPGAGGPSGSIGAILRWRD